MQYDDVAIWMPLLLANGSMCRAAFMCGREPNFELSEEEKLELRKYTWEDFLAVTRNTITSKSKTQIMNF